jgi:hypothetical protein
MWINVALWVKGDIEKKARVILSMAVFCHYVAVTITPSIEPNPEASIFFGRAVLRVEYLLPPQCLVEVFPGDRKT